MMTFTVQVYSLDNNITEQTNMACVGNCWCQLKYEPVLFLIYRFTQRDVRISKVHCILFYYFYKKIEYCVKLNAGLRENQLKHTNYLQVHF